MLSKKSVRASLILIAKIYRKESNGDTKFLTDLMLDVDRVLNGIEPRNPFYLWDALMNHSHEVVASGSEMRDQIDLISDQLMDLVSVDFSQREAA